MSLIEKPIDSLRNNNRCLLVVGPRGTGKTSFSVSASQFAGRSMEGDKDDTGKRQRLRKCDDVLVVQGDSEGVLGAMDLGLMPGGVLDMTQCETWFAYLERLKAGLSECGAGTVDSRFRIVVVDLNFPAKLIERHVEDGINRDPNRVVQLGIKDWRVVANKGLELFRIFGALRGTTVIGNAQIKASFSGMETPAAADAASARAIGGERAQFSVDLSKGVASPWLDNCSFMMVRRLRYLKERDTDGERQREYTITMQSSQRDEAKSRAQNRLPRYPLGSSTMRCILEQAYGKSI